MAAVVLFSYIITCPVTIYKIISRSSELKNIEVCFGEKNISLISNGVVRKETPYNCVKTVKESEHFYIVIFEDKEKLLSYLPVKKDAFLTQSDGFKNFIIKQMTV